MVEVDFYDAIDDSKLKFAVIIARKDKKLIFCKHRERDTYEIPGGHREPGEDILDTAKRELHEETGATDFDIVPVCVYSVNNGDEETYGMLYYAEVIALEDELHNEIEKIVITNELPSSWTYPLIQPKLLEEAQKRGYR